MSNRDPTSLEPRKHPVQSRSKALVDAIRTAAIRVLVEEGFEGLKVPAICELAGVSPGSFYQYFPHKEAVLYDVLRGHAADVTEHMIGVLSRSAELDQEALIRACVDAFIAAHADEPALHAELGRIVASRAGPGLEEDLAVQFEAVLEALISRRMQPDDPRDSTLLAFTAFRTLEGTVHAAARDRPILLRDPAFAEALTTMLVALFDWKPRPTSVSSPRS